MPNAPTISGLLNLASDETAGRAFASSLPPDERLEAKFLLMLREELVRRYGEPGTQQYLSALAEPDPKNPRHRPKGSSRHADETARMLTALDARMAQASPEDRLSDCIRAVVRAEMAGTKCKASDRIRLQKNARDRLRDAFKARETERAGGVDAIMQRLQATPDGFGIFGPFRRGSFNGGGLLGDLPTGKTE